MSALFSTEFQSLNRFSDKILSMIQMSALISEQLLISKLSQIMVSVSDMSIGTKFKYISEIAYSSIWIWKK